jgi:hypothetical protein
VDYSIDVADVDPISLACAYWLWDRHCPGVEFPEFGQLWRCWTHDDEHPSASFFVKDGDVKVRCQAEKKSYALADLYALEWGLTKLTPAQLVLYYARLRLDSGVAQRPEVPHTPLDPSWRANARKLYDGFIEFMECKWLDRGAGAHAFSMDLAAAWPGIPVATVKVLWINLRAAGMIRVEDTTKIGPYKANLYLPKGCDNRSSEVQ